MAAEARSRHKDAVAKGLAAASQLVELQDVTSLSTAQLVAKVAGDALAAPPSGGGAKPAAAVQQLLERFERWVGGGWGLGRMGMGGDCGVLQPTALSQRNALCS